MSIPANKQDKRRIIRKAIFKQRCLFASTTILRSFMLEGLNPPKGAFHLVSIHDYDYDDPMIEDLLYRPNPGRGYKASGDETSIGYQVLVSKNGRAEIRRPSPQEIRFIDEALRDLIGHERHRHYSFEPQPPLGNVVIIPFDLAPGQTLSFNPPDPHQDGRLQ